MIHTIGYLSSSSYFPDLDQYGLSFSIEEEIHRERYGLLPSLSFFAGLLTCLRGEHALGFGFSHGKVSLAEDIALRRARHRVVGITFDEESKIDGERMHPARVTAHDLVHLFLLSLHYKAWEQDLAAIFAENVLNVFPEGLREGHHERLERLLNLSPIWPDDEGDRPAIEVSLYHLDDVLSSSPFFLDMPLNDVQNVRRGVLERTLSDLERYQKNNPSSGRQFATAFEETRKELLLSQHG